MASGDWDTAIPADTDQISAGDDSIRDFKSQVEARMLKEHTDFSTANAGGEHIAGSAMVYHSATTAPTLRPDGSTSFTSADEGRIWWDSDDDKIYLYDGSDFTTQAGYLALDGGTLSGNIVMGDNSVTGVDTITFTDTGTIAGIINQNLVDKTAATEFSGNITFSGSETFAGITNTDLLDLSANETITGSWIFSAIVTMNNSGASEALLLANTGAGQGLHVTAGSNASAIGIKVTSTGDGVPLHIEGGTGTHINFADAITNSSISAGDLWNTTEGLRMSPSGGGGSHYIPLATGGVGGTSSAGSGNEYIVIKVNGVQYKVLHDGIIP